MRGQPCSHFFSELTLYSVVMIAGISSKRVYMCFVGLAIFARQNWSFVFASYRPQILCTIFFKSTSHPPSEPLRLLA